MPAATYDPTPLSFDDGFDTPEPAVVSVPAEIVKPYEPQALKLWDPDEPVEPEVITTTHQFGYGATTSVVPAETDTVLSSEQADEAEVERIVANHSRTDLVVAGAFTEWRQLRDYVIAALEERFGRFPRNPIKEKAIFESFFKRWGDKAEPIARSAVEVHNCWWANAPISVNRFAKNSDPYFAAVILTQL